MRSFTKSSQRYHISLFSLIREQLNDWSFHSQVIIAKCNTCNNPIIDLPVINCIMIYKYSHVVHENEKFRDMELPFCCVAYPLPSEDVSRLKLPRDIHEAKDLGRLLSKYKNTHYGTVLGAVVATYVLYPAAEGGGEEGREGGREGGMNREGMGKWEKEGGW